MTVSHATAECRPVSGLRLPQGSRASRIGERTAPWSGAMGTGASGLPHR